jgi:hypothetical protein
MGLMNDELVKFGVDLLTKIITLLDKATSAFEGFGGAIGKIGLALTVFKIGKVLLDKFVVTLQERFREAGIKTGQGFGQGFKEGMNGAQQAPQDKQPGQPGQPEQPGQSEQPEKEKKASGFFGQTRENFRQGWGTLGEASSTLTESQSLQKEAKNNETLSKQKKTSGTAQVGTGVAKIEAEFKKKMSTMTGSTEKAEKAWEKYADQLKKGGKTGYAAIQSMNKELQDTADLNDSIDAMDPDAFPTSEELKSMSEWKEGFRDITQGNKDLAESEDSLAMSELQREEATRLANEADQKSQQGMAQLGAAMNTVG